MSRCSIWSTSASPLAAFPYAWSRTYLATCSGAIKSHSHGRQGSLLANPIKLLPNGHFLINFGGAGPDGLDSMMQELDLGGKLIWQMTAAQLNTALAAATCAGCNITVLGTHHDFVMLPNGHLIVIACSAKRSLSGT